MGSLTRATTAQLRQEIARQIDDIELAGELTKVALREVTAVHEYGVEKVAETLKDARREINRASRYSTLDEPQQYQIHQQTVIYLGDMLNITNHGSRQITEVLIKYSTPRR